LRKRVRKPKREIPASCYDIFESEHQRKRKRKKGSPLRETSEAHGHVMVFLACIAEERCFAEAVNLTT